MFNPEQFTYYDFRQNIKSQQIELLFPGWDAERERLVILSPHDDDAVIGAGYALLAAMANGAEVHIVIFCDGWAGYSKPEEEATIIDTRKQETIEAYRIVGIPASHIHRFFYPDFGLWPWMGWKLPGGIEGTTSRFITLMRQIKPTRMLVVNGYREHLDHEATYRVGSYDGPQAGDPILASLGRMDPVRSYLIYSVWGDFSPEDALVNGSPVEVRANRAIQVPLEVEALVGESIKAFASQGEIIFYVMQQRKENRFRDGKGLELYITFNPRPPLDYQPYHRLIQEIK